MMSLRAVLWRSNLLVVAEIASSRSASALLATTWAMKSLDEESAEILKAIKALL